MNADEFQPIDVSAFPDETAELDFLPNLEERRQTLMRANAALERARVLLERVRNLDAKSKVNKNETPSDSLGG